MLGESLFLDFCKCRNCKTFSPFGFGKSAVVFHFFECNNIQSAKCNDAENFFDWANFAQFRKEIKGTARNGNRKVVKKRRKSHDSGTSIYGTTLI